jgi:hypothetical protein
MKFLDNRRGAAAAAVSALFLVPLGVFGAPALAKTAASASEYEYSGSSQYQYKVTLCHHTHSKKHPFHQIRVAAPAVKAHMRSRGDHGATAGGARLSHTTATADSEHLPPPRAGARRARSAPRPRTTKLEQRRRR